MGVVMPSDVERRQQAKLPQPRESPGATRASSKPCNGSHGFLFGRSHRRHSAQVWTRGPHQCDHLATWSIFFAFCKRFICIGSQFYCFWHAMAEADNTASCLQSSACVDKYTRKKRGKGKPRMQVCCNQICLKKKLKKR
ncbi:hypothetical protein TW95_gp0835 [Pandoravirus inopinatum]|uniref:Uncharacterized protein n=1 Tax=Pandoravirus inopinatum TaxID=1605721 RepID=A0A0B5J1Z4_9VIRU|nr:hypothetical protein TW95_gp0835 [Pandoravirus inopinatum]AJF97569.1 hypothetical protein [Pandoravirus inopinatum]